MITTDNNNQYWGISFHIDARMCDGNIINSKEKLLEWAHECVKDLEMELYREPECIYFGNEPNKTGLSIIALIQTSNIICHCNEFDNSAYIDIFSCKEFDIDKAQQTIVKYFSPSKTRVNLITRDAG